jgi:tetratricopeptide (TPR) repeat protein/serine/threonine protein kinase
MNADSRRARSIFLKAVEERRPDEWDAYLDETCGNDAELRNRVAVLLKAHAENNSLLDVPVGALVATVDRPIAERPGTVIGPYKLLEQIGEGGFGVVFMAEQQQPVRRKVALKVLKPGMDTRQIVARFEAERQALALMDHPNIAHVFDGGTTDGGRPYFVMELVRGVPITEFCDQSCLAIRQRLELFVDVCQAVQHAHQKGIIHRDIKPTNVMVTLHDGTPVVKVIDFGIAKAMGQQLTEKTLFTNFAQLIGTPLYMSPEQAEMSGLDVDTRSDIYALGVLLYELLTGTTPFESERLSKVGYDEMRRIIREEEPPKPSARMSTVGKLATTASQKRQGDPRKLTRLFRGELDWIVMKALEKDRSRRYETANGLAMDVQRYLRDEAVLACPPSTGYRFRKFARRRKTALVMAACVLLSLAGVAGGVGWAVRDKAAREDAIKLDRLAREKALSQVVERNLDEAGPLVEEGKWPQALAILERTEQLLASAAWTARPARLLELNKAVAVAQRLDRIYQGPRRSSQPRPLPSTPDGADHSVPSPQDVYDEAFFWGRQQEADFAAVFRDLGIDIDALSAGEAAEKIQRQSIRTALVRALDGWAVFSERSRHELRSKGKFDSRCKKLIEIARQADGDEWRNRCREALLKSDRQGLEQLADAVPVRQTPPESLYLLGEALRELGAVDQAIALLERAQYEYPGDLWLNDALASSWRACQPPRWDIALRYYTAVLALRPDFSPIRLALGDALQAQGAHEKALLEYSKAVELEPTSVVVWTIRGELYRALRRYEQAIADYSKAIELEPNNGTPRHLRIVAYLEAGQYDVALADAKQAVELDTGSTQATIRADLGRSLWYLARVLSSTSKRAEAETTLREALKVFEDLASEHPQERYYRQETAFTLRELYGVVSSAGRTEEAADALRRAVDLYAALVAEEPQSSFYRSEVGYTCYDLANYLRAQQRAMEAERYFHLALDARRTLVDEAPTSERRVVLAFTHNALAALYLDAHRLAEAEEAYRASIEIFRKLAGEATFPGAVPWHLGDTCCALTVNIFRNTGRATEANELCRQVAQECRSAVDRQKQLVDARNLASDRSDLAGSLRSLARLLNELDEVQEAERCCRDALRIRQKLAADSNTAADRFSLADVHCHLGELLMRQGRADEADQSYRAARAIYEELAVKSNHEDHRTHVAWTNAWLGELAEAAGRLDEAAAAYRQTAEVWHKLVADFPNVSLYGDEYSRWMIVLANVYDKQGRSQQAAEVLTALVEKSPNQAAALRGRGELYARLALLPEAAADLAHAYERQEPSDGMAACFHALLRLHVADAAGYREACRLILTRFTDSMNPDDWGNGALTLGTSGASGVEPATVVDLTRRAAANNKLVWRQANVGLALYRAGDFQRAVEALEESLAMNSAWNTAWVYSALAMAWHQLGNSQQAEAALGKAAAARDERVDAMLSSGLGDWPAPWWDVVSTELLCKEAHSLLHGSPPPDDPRWLVLRGRGLEALGRAEEARDAFDRAFALAPDTLLIRVGALPHVSAAETFAQRLSDAHRFYKEHPQQPPAARLALGLRHAGLARLYVDAATGLASEGASDEARAKFREAIAAYTKVIDIELDSPKTHNNLAWLYATSPIGDVRDPTKAVALAKKALELRPSEGAIWNTLGVAHYRAGDWKAAMEALTKSMELRAGGDAFDWFFLAMAHWQLGQCDDARKWHKQAVEWMEKHKPHDAELLRFRAEAEELLKKADTDTGP